MYAQLLSLFSQVIAGVADGIITGKYLGVDNLAAYGFASFSTSIVLAFAGLAMTGISILCANSISGANDDERTSIFSTSMIFAATVGIVFSFIIIIFSKQLAIAGGARGNIIILTSQYLQGYGIGIIPMVMVETIFPILQLDGDKKKMTFSFLAMSIIDIILDLVNVYVIHFGIFGMGAATAFSEMVAFVILLLHFKGNNSIFKFKINSFELHYIADIFVLGYMYIAKQLLITANAFIFNNYLMLKYGSNMVAVYTAITSAGSICFGIGMSIGGAVSVLTSVYAGEKDGNSIRKTLKAGFEYSIIISVIVMIIVNIFAKQLVGSYFKNGGELMGVAVHGFRLFSMIIVIRSINICIRGYYQGMKMQKQTILFSLFYVLLFTIICMYILDNIIGISGVWLSAPVGEVIALVVWVVIMHIIAKGKEGIDVLLFLPKDYDTEDSSITEGYFNSKDEINDYIRELRNYFNQNKIDIQISDKIVQTIKNVTEIIIEHGFDDKSKHAVEIKVREDIDGWNIRVRDDCKPFDMFSSSLEQVSENTIINSIKENAKKYRYHKTFNMNNIYIEI